MKLKFGVRYCLVILLLAMVPVQAEDIDRDLDEARTVFLQGVDGDRRAVRNALQRFRSLSHGYPREPVFVAYLGACMTLQGRDAPNNIDKKRLTEEGLEKIDRALERLSANANQESPRYLDTLLVAANSFIHIPSFFNRHDQGKRLLEEILAHRNFDTMAAGFRAATYLASALVAHGEGDDGAYRRYLNLAVSADPEGRDGRSASKLLEELGQKQSQVGVSRSLLTSRISGFRSSPEY